MTLLQHIVAKVHQTKQQQERAAMGRPMLPGEKAPISKLEYRRSDADPYNRRANIYGGDEVSRPPPLYINGVWNDVYERPNTAPPIQMPGMDAHGRNIKELSAGTWYSNEQNRRMLWNHQNKMAEASRAEKRMVSDNPLPNKVAAMEKLNPMAQARLYASNDGREMSKMVMHGFAAEKSLIKPTLLSKQQMDEDQLRGGLKGQVDDHYNEAMFDKERDL